MEHSNLKMFSNFTQTFDFKFNDLSLENLFTTFCSIGIIFGGIIPYIPQYRQIYVTKNAEGFSINVCFVLLTANILRIVFWFGNSFEKPLLIQSIVMIIAMLAMVELCVRVKNQNVITSRYFFDIQLKYFWKWTDFLSYIECLATIALISGLLMYFLINYYYFVQSIGFIALITESLLGVPQVIHNYKNRSTKGVNKTMVFLWLAGDIFKTAYFVIKKTPLQFWVCGIIQVTVDLFIIFQVFLYGQMKYRMIFKGYR